MANAYEQLRRYQENRAKEIQSNTPQNMFAPAETVPMGQTPTDTLPTKTFYNDDGSRQDYILTNGTATQLLHGLPQQEQINSLIDLAKRGNSQAVTLLDKQYNFAPRQNKQATISSQAIYDDKTGSTWEHPYKTVYGADGNPYRVSAGDPWLKQDNYADLYKALATQEALNSRAWLANAGKNARAQSALDNKTIKHKVSVNGVPYYVETDGNGKVLAGTLVPVNNSQTETQRIMNTAVHTSKNRDRQIPPQISTTASQLVAMGRPDMAQQYLLNYLNMEKPERYNWEGSGGLSSDRAFWTENYKIPTQDLMNYIATNEKLMQMGVQETYPMRERLGPWIQRYYEDPQNAPLNYFNVNDWDYGGWSLKDLEAYKGEKKEVTIPPTYTPDYWEKEPKTAYVPRDGENWDKKQAQAELLQKQAEAQKQAQQTEELEKSFKPFKDENEKFAEFMKFAQQKGATEEQVDAWLENVAKQFADEDSDIFLSSDGNWYLYVPSHGYAKISI